MTIIQQKAQRVVALNGDEAVAYAVKQCGVDVVAAYPITPQTIIVERFSEYVHNGEVATEFICTESEHSALTCCLTASAVGARTFTATASAGLALMHEILYVTSGCRAPVVMAVANRALSAPINIHCDHSDTMGERDSGWIQLYAENVQEVYDSIIQAFRIAENEGILLPTLVAMDGFFLTHTLESINVLTDDVVQDFVGQRRFSLEKNHEGKLVPFKLDPEKPMTMGPLVLYDYYFELKRQQEEAMNRATETIKKVHKEYAEISGRRYGDGVIEQYRLEDAEIATICLGSTAGTIKTVVDQFRLEGVKAGLLRIRAFRPIPVQHIIKALRNVKVVAVLDRSCSFGGYGGPLFHEIKNVLYNSNTHPHLINYIYGLGGRDMPQLLVKKIFYELVKILEKGRIEQPVKFIGLRE